MINIVVYKMIEEAKENYLPWVGEDLNNTGTGNCSLSNNRGGIYGIAILLENDDRKRDFFDRISSERKNCRIKKVEEWKPIGQNYYPLYWGSDCNLGFRLFEHTKNNKTSSSIDLSDLIFRNEKIIYGAILCKERQRVENLLHKNFTDLLRNKK